MARVITVKNWNIRRVSGNLFRLIYDATSNRFTLTGGADTIDAKITTPHFRGIDIERIFAIFDDDTTKTFKVEIIPEISNITLDNTLDVVNDTKNNVTVYAIGLEGAKFISEVTIRFTITGTLNKTVQPIIYFSLLEKGESPEPPMPGTVEQIPGGGKHRSPFKITVLRDAQINPSKIIKTLQAVVAKNATFIGATVNLPYMTKGIVFLDVTAASGTAPTLDVTLEMLDSLGGDWVEIAAFAQVAAALTAPQFIIIGLGCAATSGTNEDEFVPMMMPPQIRVKATIGGTSPIFTYSVSLVGL